MEHVRDEVIARRAASGDMEAFEELVNRHRMAVYRLARSITGNHDDADDAAQETFIRVYRALGTYDPGRSFKAWLKRIAYNTSLNVCEARPVPDIDVEVNVDFLGNGKLSICVYVTNNDASLYRGQVRAYITEIESSMGWLDTAGKPYTYAFLDYAVNQHVDIPGNEQ